MNEPLFDIRGNLIPYAIIDASLADIEHWFVAPFGQASSRHTLYREYQRYTDDLRTAIGHPFYQWVNGGFIRNTENPGDIDVVSFITHEAYATNESLIDTHFGKRAVGSFYIGMDAYTVRTYPTDHKNFLTFQADEAYWYDWFSKTRRDRYQKQHRKGFLRINVS